MATSLSWPSRRNDSALGNSENGIRWNSSLEPLRPSKNRVSSALPRQATFPMVSERPATLPKMRRRIKSAPIGSRMARPLSDPNNVVYCDLLKRRLNPLEQVPRIPPGSPSQQRRFSTGGWMMSPEEKDTSDDEWDELLFEIDEESYWNKKLGKLLIITQIPLHLKTRADKLEWLKSQFRSPRRAGGGRQNQRPTTAQLERLLDRYERKHGQDGDDQSARGNRRRNRSGFNLEAVDEGEESESDDEWSRRDRSGLRTAGSLSRKSRRASTGFGNGDDSDETCSRCGSDIGDERTMRSRGSRGTAVDTDGTRDGLFGTGSRGDIGDLDGLYTGRDGRGTGFGSEGNKADGLHGSGEGDMMRGMLNRKKDGDALTSSRSSMSSDFSTVSRRSRRSDLANTAQGHGLRGGTELNDLAAISGAGKDGSGRRISGHINGADGMKGYDSRLIGVQPDLVGQRENESGVEGEDSKRRLGGIGTSSRQILLSSSRRTGSGTQENPDGQSSQLLQSPSHYRLADNSQSSFATGPPPHTRPEAFSSRSDTHEGPISGRHGVAGDGSKHFPGSKKLLQLPDLYSLGITRAFTYSYFTLPVQYRDDNDRWSRAAWNKTTQVKKKSGGK